MRIRIATILVACVAACQSVDSIEVGPPVLDDSEVLASGKQDGGPGLGQLTVSGQKQGRRTTFDPPSPETFCAPGDKISFDVRYENHSLPFGARLYLWRGMEGWDGCGGCEPATTEQFTWRDHQVTEIVATAPWTWDVGTKNENRLAEAMNFVVKIVMPDGSVRWDNGGSNWGYYQVDVPDPICDPNWMPDQWFDSSVQAIPAHTFRR